MDYFALLLWIYIWIHLAFASRVGRPRRQFQVSEINIQVTAPLFAGRLYDYGEEAGDTALPKELDAIQELSLSSPIYFLGEEKDSLFISSNGVVGFSNKARGFNSENFPDGPELIAPFWTRNDLRKGGMVYFREITEGRVLDRAESEVRYQYETRVQATNVLLITWENMHPIQDLDSNEYEPNTFQVAIVNTGNNGTFANFIYKTVGWSQAVQVGFNKGDSSNHYALPDTINAGERIVLLAERGNTGIPGEWMFRIDMENIVRCRPGIKGDTCDRRCDPEEWGYDCANCCHCADGSCNSTSGHCDSGICSECWTGFPACQSRDLSCKTESKACGHNAISFTNADRCGEPIVQCECLSGYLLQDLDCIDIDECETNNTCSENARCVNTPGRFYCECLEGFVGDGNLCTKNFLFDNSGHEIVPPAAIEHIPWSLNQEIKIFGQRRRTFWVLPNGLILLKDAKLGRNTDIEDTNAVGFAPFFAEVNLKAGGTVTVGEVTDPAILLSATETIIKHFPNAKNFLARSLFVVTFLDVVQSQNQDGNTYQVAIINGEIGDSEATYIEYLFKTLSWSDRATSMILSPDSSFSIILPGSGSDGVRQLSRLSNVGEPGRWIFRVDDSKVQPCPDPHFAPPYCLDSVPSGSAIPVRTLGPVAPTNKIQSTSIDEALFGTAQTKSPEDELARKTSKESHSSVENDETPSLETNSQNPSTGDESVGFTFPEYINIVPELITPAGGVSIDDGIVSSTRSPQLIFSPEDRPSSREGTDLSRFIIPTRPRTSSKTPFKSSSTPGLTNSISPTSKTISTTSVVSSTVPQTKPSTEISSTASNAETAIAKTMTKEVVTLATTKAPIHVFTKARIPTTPRTRTRPRPPIVTARPYFPSRTTFVKPPKVKTHLFPANFYEKEKTRGSQTDPNMMAIVIPTVIVGVWLVLLVVIGLIVCIRKRRNSEHQLRRQRIRKGDKYCSNLVDESFGVGGPPTRYASYEDHLDKAARLSELNQYSQSSRAYGSYWNMPSTRASYASNGFYNQGYYESCPEFSRYGFNRRY